MRVRSRGRWVVASLCAALGCGGGGSSDTGSNTATPFFDVAGDIQIAFASAIDGDTNDPAADSTPNDTPATAQPIPNPVTLGGYVNVPNQGDSGRSFTAGDPVDDFRVSLAEGQTVRLFMAGDGVNDDLDLALIDANGLEVDSSDTNTAAEDVVAPAPGEYVIEVSAFSGASSYVLSIGQATGAALAPPAESVPGELIVRYREGGSLRAEDQAGADAARLGLVRVGGGAGGPQLLAGRETSQLDVALERVGKGHLSEAARVRRGAAAARDRRERDTALRRDTRRLAKALRRRADVASADPNYIRHASAVPTDEFYPRQWHYPLVALPEAWDLVQPASGVVVAVIDTGVIENHPELQGQLVAGYDFIQNSLRSRDGDGCDANPHDDGDRVLPNGDSSFHGTHVIGTVVARTSLQPGGDSAGVAGVAWNAKVMPLRVLGLGGGTDFDLIQALRYAAGLSNACGALPAAPADVINLSLGGSAPSSTLEAAITQVRAAGLVVVAAAGNGGTNAPVYPAAFPGVISVSAVDAARQLAPYSNFGPTIDVAAPGGDLSRDRNEDELADAVLSTFYDEGTGEFIYAGYQGTSMAAPHVAGVIALMLGENSALTPADIDNLLASGAMTTDIGSSTFFGRGLIDAFESVERAIEARGGAVPGVPPRLVADPGAVNFGASSTQVNVRLENAGGPAPAPVITSFEAITDDGGAWLTIEAGSVDAAGLGTYTVRVTRTGLADGIYTGAARFHSNIGDLDVPVIVQVGDAVTPDADAGHHYVLLVDPATDPPRTVFAVEVEAQDGRYRYRFVDVDPGRYYIYAGTDVDNDNFLCDRGEACGSYPTLEQPRVIEVEDDLRDLDFLTGFGLRIGASSTHAADSGIPRLAVP